MAICSPKYAMLIRTLSTVPATDRPWLSYGSNAKGNPLMRWPIPKAPPKKSFDSGSSIPRTNPLLETKGDDDAATICKIVRENEGEMDAALDNCGIKMDPQLMEKVLEMCEYSWKPIFRCFSWAGRQSGYKHTSKAYNSMINIMARMREFDSAWVLVNNMKSEGLITSETFAILMRRYARAGMVKAALRTFDLMEHFGCKADLDAFNVLLGALCKENKVHPATVIFEQRMPKLVPSTMTYNILINGWCRVRRILKAKILLDQMVSRGIPPSVVTFSTLIDGYCRSSRVEDALKLLRRMKAEGCEPNVITYNSIIDALGEGRRSREALAMLDEMGANGCTPNISTYNSLVKGLCKQEHLADASKILKMMIERGCLPTATTYNYFFRFFSKYGRIKEGMNLYTKMIELGYDPDRLTYQLLIKMLCEKGRVMLALQVKKDMDMKGCDCDLATCTMLIHRLCRLGKLEEACQHFEAMIRKGIPPQYITYEMLADGLRKSGQPDKVRLLSDMMAQTAHSTRLPNTYKKGDAQQLSDSILDKAQEISQRLISGMCSKQLTETGSRSPQQGLPKTIVETACQLTEQLKAIPHYR